VLAVLRVEAGLEQVVRARVLEREVEGERAPVEAQEGEPEPSALRP
jgi:hypothetical protein